MFGRWVQSSVQDAMFSSHHHHHHCPPQANPPPAAPIEEKSADADEPMLDEEKGAETPPKETQPATTQPVAEHDNKNVMFGLAFLGIIILILICGGVYFFCHLFFCAFLDLCK